MAHVLIALGELLMPVYCASKNYTGEEVGGGWRTQKRQTQCSVCSGLGLQPSRASGSAQSGKASIFREGVIKQMKPVISAPAPTVLLTPYSSV